LPYYSGTVARKKPGSSGGRINKLPGCDEVEGRVGPHPPSQEWLDQLYSEGKVRYEQKRPPGYMDIGKAKNDGAETHLFGNLLVRSEYDDLIVWKQILEESRTREQLKHLVFVTDDEKEDWWWIVRSGGSKRLGLRPELAEEIFSEAGISRFYIYNSTPSVSCILQKGSLISRSSKNLSSRFGM